jgi:hypothetical protein
VRILPYFLRNLPALQSAPTRAFGDVAEVELNRLVDGDNRAFLIFTTCAPWLPTSPPRSLTSGAAASNPGSNDGWMKESSNMSARGI